MNKLSIEELKEMRTSWRLTEGKKILGVLDELISIRELKGDQDPVAWKLTHITGSVSIEFNKQVADLFGIFNGNRVEPLYDQPQNLSDLPYDVVFNAIAKAVNIQGGSISISVKEFKAAIQAASLTATKEE